MTWFAIAVAGVGCYLLKLAGLSIPRRLLDRPAVARVADLVPVALLSALIGVQVVTSRTAPGPRRPTREGRGGRRSSVLRAPFLVVVVLAAVSAALLRLV